MEEQKAKEEVQTIVQKTEGGYDCIVSGGLTIRKSSSPRRLTEDNETYDEYKIRLKLLKQIEKEKKPNYIWVSRFSIGGQNYTATYNKQLQKDKKFKLEENEGITE